MNWYEKRWETMRKEDRVNKHSLELALEKEVDEYNENRGFWILLFS